MRVLITIFEQLVPISGGGTPRNRSIIDVLVERGHEVSVAASLNVDVKSALEVLKCHEIFPLKDVSRLDKNKMKKYIVFHPFNISKVVEGAMKTKPDIIIAHNSIAGLAGFLAKKATGCLDVLGITDLIFEYLTSFSKHASWAYLQKIGRKLEETAIRQADKIITISHAMKEILVQKGAERENVDVIYDGVNVDLFKLNEAEAVKLRQKYAAGTENVVMLHGVIDPQDGPEIVVEAAASVLERHPPTLFWLVGDGAAIPGIKEGVRRMGIGKNFFFSGWMPYEDVPGFISACDVGLVILPNTISARITTHLKSFEFWACEKPVVASELPALKEIVTPWRTGLFYKPEDPDDLAEKICLLLDDKRLCKEMGRAGRRLVEKKFSWSKLATQFVTKCEGYLHDRP